MNRLESGFCLRCGGIFIQTPDGIPMCNACQERTLKQFARMKEQKTRKKKKKK